MVIFSTTDFSYHGHPDPLTCPYEWTRKSLALYYYTNGRPSEEFCEDHSTLFHARPGETFRADQDGSNWKQLVKKIVPPIIADTWKFVKPDKTHKS
jgi:hypothetical protein